VQVQTIPDPVIMANSCLGTTLNTATISWKDGLDGGSTIEEYTIYFNEVGVLNSQQYIDNIYSYTLTPDL